MKITVTAVLEGGAITVTCRDSNGQAPPIEAALQIATEAYHWLLGRKIMADITQSGPRVQPVDGDILKRLPPPRPNLG